MILSPMAERGMRAVCRPKTCESMPTPAGLARMPKKLMVEMKHCIRSMNME